MRKKFIMVLFRGRFQRGRDIFGLEIVPSAAKDNLEVKNVEVTLKYPEIMPLDIFTHTKNNILTL